MRPFRAYALRLARKRRQLRAWRKSRQLSPVALRLESISRGDILLFCTLRNEAARLPFFLEYYRRLGIGHFLFVDNGSTDGSAEYLIAQPDCSLWWTDAGYKQSRYGIDWMNHLLRRHGSGHWTLTVDVDEFLVYPHSDTRPLRALTDWLDASAIKCFGAMLIDMYSDRAVGETHCPPGADPIAAAPWFDAGNYQIRRNPRRGNLWIQGGARQRVFFPDRPEAAPALNKIPLVRWQRGYVYASSTHSLLPRGLNIVYDEWGGEKPCGALLHTKFLDTLPEKTAEELGRRQHYAGSREYRAYGARLAEGLSLWTACSTRYQGWRQLQDLGLISPGGWL
ncbi:MAG: glycosyltransferase family 2 protein [Alphaproteobacteria bacterium]|nr:MAG: glycosyltransferase family 2 protein [Alphaproteobacteria bacterium]